MSCLWIKTILVGAILSIFIYWVAYHSGYFPYSHEPMQYMPNMHRSAVLKPQRQFDFYNNLSGARVPPEGSVARNINVYPELKSTPATSIARKPNPFPRTRKVLERGQEVYNTYCIVCHGPKGLGNGLVVPPYPKVPSLHSDKVRGLADSQIFHIITRGQNTMGSYAPQIVEEDRWKAIHYLRVLQLAENPGAQDVKAFKNFGVKK